MKDQKYMKSEAKAKNDRYLPKGMSLSDGRHEKMPKQMKAYESEAKMVHSMPSEGKKRGYPSKAYDYKY